ncbi:MAG TPA: hypothetical protein VK524_21500 [Polyangiaceae bacterium]|nr:hypothetical protein [Polyangiaceae bacterium]
MKGSALARAARAAEWLAALLVCIVAGRLAWVAAEDRLARPEPSEPPAPSRTTLTPASEVPEPPPPASEQAEPAPPPSAAREPRTLGEVLRVALVITLGPERSEVRVNGVQIGQSPYVGDWTCRRDETLRIDVLPRRGAPIRVERVCLPGTVRAGE